MPHKMVISYPHMGSYAAVFRQFLRHLFPQAEILTPPPITRRTVELGAKHSPDFVCSPFKYNLGNYIEALERGANVLFQTGMGCRYGYYGELQEQILRDLGYDFRFVCLSRERARPQNALQVLRELGCALPVTRLLQALLLALHSIQIIDHCEYRLRESIGFAPDPAACEALLGELLAGLERANSLHAARAAAHRYTRASRLVYGDAPTHPLRVGVVGELYTLMEPFSNFYLEQQLAGEGIAVSRAMGLRFLLMGRSDTRSLRQSGGYLRYPVGANGVDSVAQSLQYAREGYDGVVHIKSFGCIPELNATPALMRLSRDREIPILQLSFDSHTSEAGVQTRLEAFADMLRMRREGTYANRESGRGYRLGIHQSGRT